MEKKVSHTSRWTDRSEVLKATKFKLLIFIASNSRQKIFWLENVADETLSLHCYHMVVMFPTPHLVLNYDEKRYILAFYNTNYDIAE